MEEEPPCQTWRKAFAKEQLPYFKRIWERMADFDKRLGVLEKRVEDETDARKKQRREIDALTKRVKKLEGKK